MNFANLPRFGAPIDRALDIIESTLRSLLAAPLTGAVVLAPQVINATDTRVYHGLGRRPRGAFMVQNPSVGAVLADGLVPESVDPSNFIVLRLSTAVSVTLVVF